MVFGETGARVPTRQPAGVVTKNSITPVATPRISPKAI